MSHRPPALYLCHSLESILLDSRYLHIDHRTHTFTNSHLTTVHTPSRHPHHTTSHGNMHHDDDDDGWHGVAWRGLPCSIDHTADECHMRACSPTITLRPELVFGARHIHGHGHQGVSDHQSCNETTQTDSDTSTLSLLTLSPLPPTPSPPSTLPPTSPYNFTWEYAS